MAADDNEVTRDILVRPTAGEGTERRKSEVKQVKQRSSIKVKDSVRRSKTEGNQKSEIGSYEEHNKPRNEPIESRNLFNQNLEQAETRLSRSKTVKTISDSN